MVVAQTREPQQVIYRYFNSGWWVWYQSEWIGFFPGSLWTVDFSTAGQVQWFGEVAGQLQPTTQMGDGLFPSQVDAAFMVNLAVENAAGVSRSASLRSIPVTEPGAYELTVADAGFSFGGPGYLTPAECQTCASLLANCGSVDDGCGDTHYCGYRGAFQTRGAATQPNVCLLPDGGMGGSPWEGAYFGGGSSHGGDEGAPDGGSASTQGADGNSGCRSSGAAASLFLVLWVLDTLLPRRLSRANERGSTAVG